MLIANTPLARNCARVDDILPRLTISEGGSSESEQTAVAVQPDRLLRCPVVTSATPDASSRIAWR